MLVYGISASRYLFFIGTGFISALAGSHVVYSIYQPLHDLEQMVQDEIDRIRDSPEYDELMKTYSFDNYLKTMMPYETAVLEMDKK